MLNKKEQCVQQAGSMSGRHHSSRTFARSFLTAKCCADKCLRLLDPPSTNSPNLCEICCRAFCSDHRKCQNCRGQRYCHACRSVALCDKCVSRTVSRCCTPVPWCEVVDCDEIACRPSVKFYSCAYKGCTRTRGFDLCCEHDRDIPQARKKQHQFYRCRTCQRVYCHYHQNKCRECRRSALGAALEEQGVVQDLIGLIGEYDSRGSRSKCQQAL